MVKKALITGITGQDGAYLAEFLINKGYIVHGIKRPTSLLNTSRIDKLYNDPHEKEVNFFLHHGDMTDSSSITKIIQEVKPDEIYNLAAQSHVAVSFQEPEYTANADAIGVLRILEAIRTLRIVNNTRFYQASTSELFGKVVETPQNEKTPFYPRSPYGVAKLYAYWITINFREAYGLYACNGILYNHESPLRGETFVTRKITKALSKILLGLQKCLYLGKIDVLRDWGHAKDYVEAQWLMLQQDKPDDYVISTQEQHSVREFVDLVSKEYGIVLKWQGSGLKEKGIIEYLSANVKKNYSHLKEGDIIVRIAADYFRPSEVDSLLGDSTKAKRELGWEPKISFNQLVKEMAEADLKLAKREQLIARNNL